MAEGHRGERLDGRLALCSLVLSILPQCASLALGAETIELSAASGEAEALALSADGRLAAGGRAGVVRIWDVGARRVVQTLEGHKTAVTAVSFSPDGRQFASGADDGEILFWSLDSGPPVARAALGKKVPVLGLAFRGPGRVASAGADGSFQAWGFAGEPGGPGWQAVPGPAQSAAISGDGKMAAFGAREDGAPLLRCVLLEENTSDSKGGLAAARRAALSRDGAAGVYSEASGAIRTFRCFSKAPWEASVEMKGPSASDALALSPDGALVAGGIGGGVRLWDAASGRRLFDWSGGAEVKVLAFSPDGRQLLAASADGILRLRQVPSEAEIAAREAELAAQALEHAARTAAEETRAAAAATAAEASREAREDREPEMPEATRPTRDPLFGLFGTLRRSAGESAVRSGLAAIRTALSDYYGDMGGEYPARLTPLTRNGKYLREIPMLWSAGSGRILPAIAPEVPHPFTRRVARYSTLAPQDTGRWGYVNNPKDKDFGTVFIDCTHTDGRGSSWTSY